MSFTRRKTISGTSVGRGGTLKGEPQCMVNASSSASLITTESNINVKTLTAKKLKGKELITDSVITKKVDAMEISGENTYAKNALIDTARINIIIQPDGWSSSSNENRLVFSKNGCPLMILEQ